MQRIRIANKRLVCVLAAIWTGMMIHALPVVYAAPPDIRYHLDTIKAGDGHFTLHLPEGYALRLLTKDMRQPRMFVFDQMGNMLVASKSGYIYRLKPPYTKPEHILTLTGYPHSLALRGRYLYIARTSGLYRVAYHPANPTFDKTDVEKVVAIPGGWGHNSRTLKVGPDDRLYVSLGITGNCSDQYLHQSYPSDDRRGGVMVLDETRDPPVWKTWANGLRNPVGFDWHPDTKIMYASNNGPDHHGYEQPPEYFSRLDKDSFHGMPWFQYNGKQLLRDDCISSKPPRQDIRTPVVTFPARNAPMDVHFISKGDLAQQYYGDAVVALHGSWGTKPYGNSRGDISSRRPPGLVLVRFEQGKAVRFDHLVSGFQNLKGVRFARPVGLGIAPDGNLYMSSDGGINGLFRLEKIE